MAKKGKLRFFLGGVVGAAIGAAAGILLAPRPGTESRAKAADAMNDAWDAALDTCEQGARNVSDYIETVRPQIDAASDELRAKVDAARERMAQVRASLSETVMTSSAGTSSPDTSIFTQDGDDLA